MRCTNGVNLYGVILPADWVTIVTNNYVLYTMQSQSLHFRRCHFHLTAVVDLVAGAEYEDVTTTCDIHNTGVNTDHSGVPVQNRRIHWI